ncbi:MAG: hypothetical protein U0P45_09945 [Acidimicrobiales bacterium]
MTACGHDRQPAWWWSSATLAGRATACPCAVAAGLAIDDDRPDWPRLPIERRLVAASTTVVALAGAAAVLLAGRLGTSGTAAAEARNVIGALGLLLLLRRWMDASTAASALTAYVVAALLLGARRDGTADAWAWPAAQRATPPDVVIALACAALGLAVSIHRR